MAHSTNYIDADSESSQHLYTPVAQMAWEEANLPAGRSSQAQSKTHQTWAPSPPAMTHTSGSNNLVSRPQPSSQYTNSTCWQVQPSVYAWQMSTKIKAPANEIDELILNVIHLQRHLYMTADIRGEELIGSHLPSVHWLFNQPGPKLEPTATSTALAETMSRYGAVLSARGFELIPEKLGSFMAMYRFVQWQIAPSYTTYQTLYEWQTPRPSQLLIEHPAWMDFPPWGKFRDKLIENQDLYGTVEFQKFYASNFSVNFPYDPMKALIFEHGMIKVSPLMEKHLANANKFSMKKPFLDRYPEFRDACRCEEL